MGIKDLYKINLEYPNYYTNFYVYLYFLYYLYYLYIIYIIYIIYIHLSLQRLKILPKIPIYCISYCISYIID